MSILCEEELLLALLRMLPPEYAGIETEEEEEV